MYRDSWRGLSGPSTPCWLRGREKDVDARDKRGHDAGGGDSISSERALVISGFEHFAARKERRQDEGHCRLGRHSLLDRAVDDEFELVMARDGVGFDSERLKHRTHGAAYQRLTEIEFAERAALRYEHDSWNLVGHDERRQYVWYRAESRGLHQHSPAPSAHPGAGHDAERLLLARGRKRKEVGVGVQVLDERGKHFVRHVGYKLHLVALEGLLHDLVPRPRRDGIGSVHYDRSDAHEGAPQNEACVVFSRSQAFLT